MNRKGFLTTLGAGTLGVNALRAAAAETVFPSPSTPPSMPSLTELLSLDDVERAALTILPPAVRDFIAGGAADELTLGWNRDKYRDIRLLEKILQDVGNLDPSVTLFGHRHKLPILIAPTANHRLAHPDGELGTVRGANQVGVTMVLSSGANTAVDEVAPAATEPLWFQLYVAQDRGLAKALIQRAESAGAKALCVTVDSPLDGARNRQMRHALTLPPGVTHPHYVGIKEPASIQTLEVVRPAVLLWRDIEWIRSLTKMKVLLKGVMNPSDAEIGVKLGADGIIVSNHGGRCLDSQPATIETLPRVAEKVAGRVPVLVDGGIRRGTDIVKALALGANAVQIGRPCLYGLAVGGADGVAHVLKILRMELLMAMSLLGTRTIAEIDRSVIWK